MPKILDYKPDLVAAMAATIAAGLAREAGRDELINDPRVLHEVVDISVDVAETILALVQAAYTGDSGV